MLSSDEQGPSGSIIRYVVPKEWSLYYILKGGKHWRDLRERFKQGNPVWDRCPRCPKGCKADTLDEEWEYDHQKHTKTFVGAVFICRGCNWLKSLTMRIKMWRDQEAGRLQPPSKPHHIIECLGRTREEVDALRAKDLKRDQRDSAEHARVEEQIKAGTAAVAPAPIERLSPERLAELAKPGQLIIVPWNVNLSALAAWGYSAEEIRTLEERMYQLAEERMADKAWLYMLHGVVSADV